MDTASGADAAERDQSEARRSDFIRMSSSPRRVLPFLELKQKPVAEAIGAVYAAPDAFQSKIVKLIEDYEAECTHLSDSA